MSSFEEERKKFTSDPRNKKVKLNPHFAASGLSNFDREFEKNKRHMESKGSYRKRMATR